MSERVLSNWSGTKTTKVASYFEPETTEELKKMLRDHKGKPVRLLGSNMSPNGCALSPDAAAVAISLRLFDKIVWIDPASKTATVQAGVTIEALLAALQPHCLTLPNLPSTTGMQLAGLTQTGSHGTGSRLAPLNEAVKEIRFVSADGLEIRLTEEDGPQFHASKCSLGTFGAVTQLTLQCVDAYYVRERLSVMGLDELRRGHRERLDSFRHVKYHYIPYTGMAVVYTYEEVVDGASGRHQQHQDDIDVDAEMDRKREMLDMHFDILKKTSSNLNHETYLKDHSGLTFSDLRARILQHDPTNLDHVKRLNRAELQFWIKSAKDPSIVDLSQRRLMFECGGRQHVKEFCCEVKDDGHDLDLVAEILSLVEGAGIPAPAPIEQRWSAASRSPLHPAYKAAGGDGCFTWVGIIMYLTGVERMDGDITDRFLAYYHLVVNTLGERFSLNEHLAKVELTAGNREALARRMRRLEPGLGLFHACRNEYDPEGTFMSEAVAEVTLSEEEGQGQKGQQEEEKEEGCCLL